MRIYLDMCCFNRPYDPQDQIKISMETQSKLIIQRLIEEGKFELIGSYTLDYECRLDYTKWRERYYDTFAPDEFHQKAVAYAKEHPYTGNAERL
ncbi:MAG: hypothetical protein IJI45_01785 [Anaerolineaceae bacterium]|nr:hypothetical protein [Anaerolineaceae bacterium]